MLLRTVHSILDNTPSHLVDTIILVDDKSTLGQSRTRHDTTQHNTMQHNTPSHLVDTIILVDDKSTMGQSWTRHDTTQYNTAKCNTVQHNALQCTIIVVDKSALGQSEYKTIQHNTPSHLEDTVIPIDDKSTLGQFMDTARYNTVQWNTVQHNPILVQSWTRHNTTPTVL